MHLQALFIALCTHACTRACAYTAVQGMKKLWQSFKGWLGSTRSPTHPGYLELSSELKQPFSRKLRQGHTHTS